MKNWCHLTSTVQIGFINHLSVFEGTDDYLVTSNRLNGLATASVVLRCNVTSLVPSVKLLFASVSVRFWVLIFCKLLWDQFLCEVLQVLARQL